MSDIRAVIVDFGNVLTMPQDATRVESMCNLSGLDLDSFLSGYRAHRHGYDRGTLDSEAYWKGVLATGGAAPRHVEGLDGDFVERMTRFDVESWTVIRNPMVEWVRMLKVAGLRIGILSNMPADHKTYILRSFDWVDLFDEAVFSCDVKLIKPEKGIYIECVNRLGVAPGEALFIDDIEANVRGAWSVGIHAIEFRDFPRLSEDLKSFPAIPLPAGTEQPDR